MLTDKGHCLISIRPYRWARFAKSLKDVVNVFSPHFCSSLIVEVEDFDIGDGVWRYEVQSEIAAVAAKDNGVVFQWQS
jgi:hypothetical protein